jgi:1-acyl-sn-glycerol-3-phosphate acyltransferase
MAGRDIGTFVLPDADLKLFLDASVEERAGRRARERGVDPGSPEGLEILDELRRRDMLDTTRAIAPLRPADDAQITRTDGNTFEQTVAIVVSTIRRIEAERGATGSPSTEAQAAAATAAESATAAETGGGARKARQRTGRTQRRPMQPTPIATRIDPLVRVVSAVLRLVVRAIVRFRIEGDLAQVPREGALIVAANHASSADPVLIGAFLGPTINRPLNWLGKRELTEFGPLGWAFRRGGIHPVDRDAADLEAFRTAMRILEAGQVLAIFPEGTRSRDGALQPVREGAGMLALRSGATVLPVAVVDSDLLWPRGRLLPRFGKRVTVRYGTPFKVADELGARAAAAGPAKGVSRDRRGATKVATRLIMTRIAAMLPSRQRGVYAETAPDTDEVAGPEPATLG